MTIFILLVVTFNFALLALSGVEGLTFNLRSAVAQTMSKDNYILQLDDINTTIKYPEPRVKDNALKDNTLGVVTEQPVKKQSEPFTFSISQTLIDFSTLSPTDPIRRSNQLTISRESANGYSIIAFEDKELSSSQSSAFIPDTTCDNGQCSESSSGPWTNPLTYGFGYRCDNVLGSHCGSEFSNTEFYKQFANASMSETPQKVASGTNAKKEKTVRITYKINIPIAQPFAFYSNTITYIAVPNF